MYIVLCSCLCCTTEIKTKSILTWSYRDIFLQHENISQNILYFPRCSFPAFGTTSRRLYFDRNHVNDWYKFETEINIKYSILRLRPKTKTRRQHCTIGCRVVSPPNVGLELRKLGDTVYCNQNCLYGTLWRKVVDFASTTFPLLRSLVT